MFAQMDRCKFNYFCAGRGEAGEGGGGGLAKFTEDVYEFEAAQQRWVETVLCVCQSPWQRREQLVLVLYKSKESSGLHTYITDPLKIAVINNHFINYSDSSFTCISYICKI